MHKAIKKRVGFSYYRYKKSLKKMKCNIKDRSLHILHRKIFWNRDV